jgi:hypothetical protein
MLELNGATFYKVVNWLTSIERNGLWKEQTPEWELLLSDLEPDGKQHTEMLTSARNIAAAIRELPTPVTAMALGEMVVSIESRECRVKDLVAHAQEVGRTFRRELSTINCYIVHPDRVKYLGKNQPQFGPRVADKYPMAEYDIEEAGKCLALQRPTACVMHLMRVLEIGLQSLAREMGAPDQENWNTMLNQIDRLLPEITAKRFTHEEEQWFSEVGSHFRLLKNGFRNHAMHVREKYSDEQAENIFNHTKVFMQQLATRLCDPLGYILS